MRVEVERGQRTVDSFQFSVFSYRFSVIGCEISELLGRVKLLGKPGKVGKVGKPGNRGNFRKMLIYNIVVFRDCTAFVHYCTAFVVYCTALGRVLMPNGTARHFVTRAAKSPRVLRGSRNTCFSRSSSSSRSTHKIVSLKVDGKGGKNGKDVNELAWGCDGCCSTEDRGIVCTD